MPRPSIDTVYARAIDAIATKQESRNMSLRRLAREAAVSHGFLSDVLAQKETAAWRTIRKLCDTLNIDLNTLVLETIFPREKFRPAFREILVTVVRLMTK